MTQAAYTLSVVPRLSKIIPVIWRGHKPFVMINMLRFKEQASGKFAHMTGVDAYRVYGDSVVKVQKPLGSKSLWMGRVDASPDELPVHSIVLLQYANPLSLFRFGLTPSVRTDARKAGLEGQWLLASTTLSYQPAPAGGIALFEIMGASMDASAFHQGREQARQLVGAQPIWHGRCDSHILGSSTPPIAQAFATWFPSQDALTTFQEACSRADVPTPYLPYTVETLQNFL